MNEYGEYKGTTKQLEGNEVIEARQMAVGLTASPYQRREASDLYEAVASQEADILPEPQGRATIIAKTAKNALTALKVFFKGSGGVAHARKIQVVGGGDVVKFVGFGANDGQELAMIVECESMEGTFNVEIGFADLDKIFAIKARVIELEFFGITVTYSAAETQGHVPCTAFKEKEKTLPDGHVIYRFDIHPAVLRSGFDGVSYATAKEAFQPVFRGINMELHGDKLLLVASDGFRLAKAELKPKGSGLIDPLTACIPRAMADTLVRLDKMFSKDNSELTIAICAECIIISHPKYFLATPVQGGEYPEWRRVIPMKTAFHVTGACQDLHHAITALVPMTDPSSNCRVHVRIENQRMVFKVLTEKGDLVATTSAKLMETIDLIEGFEFAINAKYLSEALSPMLGLYVQLHFTENPLLPIRIEVVPGNLVAVVVPLRA